MNKLIPKTFTSISDSKRKKRTKQKTKTHENIYLQEKNGKRNEILIFSVIKTFNSLLLK